MANTKEMNRITVTIHKNEKDGVCIHYSVETKDLPISSTNKVNFNVSKIFNVTDEPFASFAYPMGQILAYTMNMSVEEGLDKTLQQLRRSHKRKIAMYARKAETHYVSSKQKYTQYLNEAIQELDIIDNAIKENKVYKVPVEENKRSMIRFCM